MLSNYLNVLLGKLWLLRSNKIGATAIEYGLIAGMISVVIIGAVRLIGTNLDAAFDAIALALTPPPPPAGP